MDQAAPLVGWELPECFSGLRRLLEARLNKGGQREYVQVLRLLETFPVAEVEQRSRMLCIWERSASMPSSICCCAGSSSGRRGWIWRTIRICPWPGTYHASHRVHGAAG